MRQLLVLAFRCKPFKKNPLVRIFVNNCFLDELHVPETTGKKEITLTDEDTLSPNFVDPFTYNDRMKDHFWKVIEFDMAEEKKLDLKIEIFNDDNNYTNGFMTQAGVISLANCFVATKHVLEKINFINNKFRYTKQNYLKHKISMIAVKEHFKGQKNRNRMFPNLGDSFSANFPDAELQKTKKLSEHWVGSTGYFSISLENKLGFWRPAHVKSRGRWRKGYIDVAREIYNKYKTL